MVGGPAAPARIIGGLCRWVLLGLLPTCAFGTLAPLDQRGHMSTRLPSSVLLGLGALLPGCEATTSCFRGPTHVSTASGPRRIDTLEVGDRVWAMDIETQQVVLRTILHTHRFQVAAFLRLVFEDGRTIEVTDQHPFWDPSRHKWRAAGSLTAGFQALVWSESAGASRARLQSVETVQSTPVDVYDLTVDGLSNFFAEQVLVHNKTLWKPPTLHARIIHPVPDLEVSPDESIEAVGSCSADCVGFAAEWKVNGETICTNTVDDANQSTCALVMDEGEHIIELSLEPSPGTEVHVFDDTVTLYAVADPPDVDLHTPEPDAEYEVGEAIWVEATLSDPDTELADLTIDIESNRDGSVTPTASNLDDDGTYSASITLSVGDHVLTVRATDPHGQVGQSSTPVTVVSSTADE